MECGTLLRLFRSAMIVRAFSQCSFRFRSCFLVVTGRRHTAVKPQPLHDRPKLFFQPVLHSKLSRSSNTHRPAALSPCLPPSLPPPQWRTIFQNVWIFFSTASPLPLLTLQGSPSC